MTIPVVGAGPMVLTWEPAGVEAVFKEDPETFVPALPEGAAVIAGEASVFMTSGERHKRVRKMLMPSFHGERMRAYGTLMRDATLRWTAAWEAGRPFRFLDTTQAVTLDVIIEAIFGVRDSERMRRFHAQIVATIGSFNPLVMVFAALRHDFMGLGPWARFRRDYDAIRAMVFEEIAARRADPAGRSDVLSMLVAARDDQGEGFADQEIFEQLFTLVLAGHETGAASIAWACDLVHRHPEVLARLRDELAPLGPELDPAVVTPPALPRGRLPRDAAALPPHRDRDPQATAPVHPPRLRAADGRHPRGPRHARAPPPGGLPRPGRLPARALRRAYLLALRVLPLRRRQPPLRGRRVRALRDEDDPRDDARAPPPRALRAEGPAQRRARGDLRPGGRCARRAGVAGVRPTLTKHSQGVGVWVHPHPRGKAVGPASEYACAHER
jgi:hypothetical protein